MISSCLLAGALAFSPAEPTPAEWSSRVGETVVLYDRPGNRFEGELVAYDQEKDRLVLESEGNTMLLPADAMSLVPTEGPDRIVVTEADASLPRVQGPPSPPPRPPRPPHISAINGDDPIQVDEWDRGTRRLAIGGGFLAFGTASTFAGSLGLWVATLPSCEGCSPQQWEESQLRSRRQMVSATVLTSVGVASVITGFVLMTDGIHRRQRARDMSLQPSLSRQGGSLSLTGRF